MLAKLLFRECVDLRRGRTLCGWLAVAANLSAGAILVGISIVILTNPAALGSTSLPRWFVACAMVNQLLMGGSLLLGVAFPRFAAFVLDATIYLALLGINLLLVFVHASGVLPGSTSQHVLLGVLVALCDAYVVRQSLRWWRLHREN